MEVNIGLVAVDKDRAFVYNEDLVGWLQNEYQQTKEILVNSIDTIDEANKKQLVFLKARCDVYRELLLNFNLPT